MNIINEFNRFMIKAKKLESQQHQIMDLNLAEIHTLVTIGKKEAITITELAEIRKVSKSAISQLTKKLEVKNLIIKKIETNINAKEVKLKLTDKGRIAFAIHQEQQQFLEKEINCVLKEFSPEQLKTIIELMHKIEDKWDNLPWNEVD